MAVKIPREVKNPTRSWVGLGDGFLIHVNWVVLQYLLLGLSSQVMAALSVLSFRNAWEADLFSGTFH